MGVWMEGWMGRGRNEGLKIRKGDSVSCVYFQSDASMFDISTSYD